jgi:t-SNARE complex subunit (syntaxin)
MSSGPSKQELDMYWKNSRQYFDELAKHYRETDPEYYNKYIAPYYANPFVSQPEFQTQSSGKQGSTVTGGGSKILTVMIAMILLIVGMGAAVFFLLNKAPETNERSRSVEKETRQTNQPEDQKIEEVSPEETPGIKEPSGEYTKGVEYFEKNEFDLAVKHLNRVSSNDPNYKDAQRLLKIIRVNKESGRDNYRKKPIERVR